MKILTRYVVREHIGPLIFALTALTSLMMLQYVARQLGNLVGKGLSWRVIAEFFVLSLPFTIALTMPMAVLVATLHAFGRMAAENEITAFKASGIRVRALMVPVMVCAVFVSLGMIAFNDQVLPAANHRLRLLQQDMARTKPTLALTEQVLNAVQPEFIIRVSRLDNERGRLFDVVIYDLSHGQERKTIYADSGYMTMAPNKSDLQLFLYDGYSQEFPKGDSRRLQRTFFKSQVVRVKDIASSFKETTSDGWKGDREKSICEMQREYVIASREFSRLRDDYLRYSFVLAKKGEAVVAPRVRPAAEPMARLYCNALALVFRVPTAPPIFPPTPPRPIVAPRIEVGATTPASALDSAARMAAAAAGGVAASGGLPAAIGSAVNPPVPQGAAVAQNPATVAGAAGPPTPMQTGVSPSQTAAATPVVTIGQQAAARRSGTDSVAQQVPLTTNGAPPVAPNAAAQTVPPPSPTTPPSQPPSSQPPQTQPLSQTAIINAQLMATPPAGSANQAATNHAAAAGVVPGNGQAPIQGTQQTVSSPPRIVPPPGIVLRPDPSVAHRDSLLEAGQARQSTKIQIDEQRGTIDNLAVEIQKKFALSAACFVFVLFGPPIALRFPRGGVGATLGVSIVAFGLYYVCLMAGETLADDGKLPAWVAMWAANVIFTVFGIVLILRMEKSADASRSGGWRDRLADWRARRALRQAASLRRNPSTEAAHA